PLAFCIDQPKYGVVKGTVGSKHETQVCIMIPLGVVPSISFRRESEPNFSTGQERNLHSLSANLQRQTGKQFTYNLIVTIDKLSESNIGNWTIGVETDKIDLRYYLDVNVIGPPVFCPGQTNSGHVSLPFGSRKVIYVCIMSREPISSVVKKGNITYSLFSAVSPSLSIRMSISKNSADKMKNTLTVAINSLSESDIGYWIIYILSEAGQLPYYLHVRAEGPPILCPDESGNKTIPLPLGGPLNVSVCYLSPGDLSQPPAVFRETKASNDGRKSSLTNKQPFETSITKMAGYKMRYTVTITNPAISPEDLGLWKVEVVDPTNGRTSFNFTVLAAGPPECPVGVNVTSQTNHSVTLTWLPGHDGGAPQSFIIFCNTSADGPLCDRDHVEMPSNSTYVSSVVDGLPADSNFLFWVEAINKYSDKKGSLVRCGKNAVEARTDPEKSAEISQIAESSEDGFSLTTTVVIVVAVVGALVVIIAVVGFLLYRWRGKVEFDILPWQWFYSSSPETKENENLKELTSFSDNEDYGYANAYSVAQPINTPRNSPVKLQEWGGPGPETDDNEVLIINPVYGSGQNVQSQLKSTELPNVGQYVNQGDLSCITVDYSAMGTFSGGDGSKEVQCSSFRAQSTLPKQVDSVESSIPGVETSEMISSDRGSNEGGQFKRESNKDK
ncbi:roundabout homolog 1, partial [Plakobranchus ocellatus]